MSTKTERCASVNCISAKIQEYNTMMLAQMAVAKIALETSCVINSNIREMGSKYQSLHFIKLFNVYTLCGYVYIAAGA